MNAARCHGGTLSLVELASMLVVAVLAGSACNNETSATTEPPLPDRASFDTNVYPLLLRDCGFSECHGAEHRFFQVFGPGRSRLAGHPSDPDLGPRERQLTYDRTRSMLVAAGGGSIFESPLLTKPLEVSAGGASHEGVDHFGRNIFQTVADSRYVMLWQWATTQQPAAATTPTVTQPIPTTPTTQAAPGPTVGAVRVGDVGSDAAAEGGEERAPEADVDAAVPGGRP